MALRNSHLDDAALADVWSARAALGSPESGRPAEAHLRGCADCRARYAAFAGWLENLRADAAAESDEVFTTDRLTAQQAQIARRLETLDAPGRVIAFPRFTQPLTARPSDGRRWIAAAAAAGLVVGLGLGQMLNFRPDSGSASFAPPQQVARGAAGDAVRVGLQPVSVTVTDESFLDEVEIRAAQARVPESLQYLNAITPSARDFDAR